MAESRIRNAFSRSTILTVGRLLAFVGVGFAVGLVMGVVTEEPDLLAAHLRGDTKTVELDDALAARADQEAARLAAREGDEDGEIEVPSEEEDGGRGLPDVAAAPAGIDVEFSPVASRAGARVAPTGSAAAAESGGWAIQVGAFGDAPSAEKLADRLEGKGYPIEVLPAGADSNRWRVRVQPIAAEKAARATAERIEREERLPTWVIRLEGQSRS